MFGADGIWRHRGGGIIDQAVNAEVARVAAVLINTHYDYVGGFAKALQGQLSEGYVDVPPEHPSYDAGLEQAFAPAPPWQFTVDVVPSIGACCRWPVHLCSHSVVVSELQDQKETCKGLLPA